MQQSPAGLLPGRALNGAPGTIRTSDPQIRSLMLYPAELRVRSGGALIEAVFGKRKPVAQSFFAAYTAAMRHPALLALPLALSACSTTGDGYPSLLPRPIESRDAGEVIRPDVIATPDAVLDSRIAERVAAAEKIATRFRALALETESRVAVARGVAPGTDSWLAAQVALADLNRARGETVEIVTALEETAAERIKAGAPPYPALDAAIATLSTAAAEQAQKVQALEDALTS
jgi:hypothetical protein